MLGYWVVQFAAAAALRPPHFPIQQTTQTSARQRDAAPLRSQSCDDACHDDT
jgi:hypothetical protein